MNRNTDCNPGSSEGGPVADVILLLPLAQEYSYLIPSELRHEVRRGVQVSCPVRKRIVSGLVMDVREPGPDDPKLSPLKDVVRTRPPWPEDLLRLLSWTSSYYVAPLGVVARTAMPSLFARRTPKPVQMVHFVRPPDRPSRSDRVKTVLSTIEKEGPVELSAARRIVSRGADVIRRMLAMGVLRIEEVDAPPRNRERETRRTVAPEFELTEHQKESLKKISGAMGGYQAFLLHGVTGSGKTEVYLQSIEETRCLGHGAIVLVPEIALTVELKRRFEERFGSEVAVIHSAMPEARRASLWDDILRGDRPIVVGARSAVFAPVPNLGLLVVDEEHENTYKQQESLRYNARDLAMVRGTLAGCPVILGSATPSLETFQNAHEKKAVYLSLPKRVRERPMPQVEFVDLRYSAPAGSERLFSPVLLSALKETVEKGESAILFLNRRGFGRFVVCGTCGTAIQCPNCSITMTHHAHPERMNCHYCDHSTRIPGSCPTCSSSEISIVGFGTQRIEEEVSDLVPGARPARLDSDTAGSGGLDRTLASFREGEFNILVGTQIVAKGHDFPMVTLVGVLLAEQSLAFPDFRASERTFQLITQVAGRAGRGDRPGRVLIQTWDPEQYALRHAAAYDYLGFAVTENRLRRERGYPPHAFLAAIEISSPDSREARNMANRVRDYLDQFSTVEGAADSGLVILGPAAAAIERIRGRSRFQILMKGHSRSTMNRVLWRLRNLVGKGHKDLRIVIDVDPISML